LAQFISLLSKKHVRIPLATEQQVPDQHVDLIFVIFQELYHLLLDLLEHHTVLTCTNEQLDFGHTEIVFEGILVCLVETFLVAPADGFGEVAGEKLLAEGETLLEVLLQVQ
jgi:hypothetical protein